MDPGDLLDDIRGDSDADDDPVADFDWTRATGFLNDLTTVDLQERHPPDRLMAAPSFRGTWGSSRVSHGSTLFFNQI